MREGCLHCQNPLPLGEELYCCEGCRVARRLLEGANLGKYYELRGGPGVVVSEVSKRGEIWLDAYQEQLRASVDEVTRLELDVQGLHCAACVWVIEQIFEREEGACEVVVNPGVGKLAMVIQPSRFNLRNFSEILGKLGYRLGPSSKEGEGNISRGLLVRIGICAALTMNVMIFTFSVYSGLIEGPLHDLMMGASWVLTSLAVLVGGGPFLKSALASLQQRALHLDIPIALGVILAYLGSSYAYFLGLEAGSYFDTVATFTTLMLVGRFLQERVLERNRKELLADDGVENLYTHILENGSIRITRVGVLKSGDRLLVRPGDLIPVDVIAPAEGVLVSREWITGESKGVLIGEGSLLEAGSFLLGDRAIEVIAQSEYASSRLAGLLRAPRGKQEQQARRTVFWSVLTRWYVTFTLLFALGAGVMGWLVGQETHRVIEIVVSVLVVSCPCAFGIAVPVAYELAQGALRRTGVFVRSASLLDRIVEVRQVVFDKTGTLTLGELEIEENAVWKELEKEDKRALWNLAIRSRHPKSRAVVEALKSEGLRLEEGKFHEVIGRGMEGEFQGKIYRLGAPGWAGEVEGADLVFQGGTFEVGFTTRERLRHDALDRINSLKKAGYAVHLLSGDETARVDALAQRLQLEPSRVKSAASPEEKRTYVEARDALMVGDGVNDAAAMESALCSATPAGDLPFLPSRADTYIQGELVTGVYRLLIVGVRLQQVVRSAVFGGLAYNVLAVSVACLGWMSPLMAAVVMPISSIAVVGYVIHRLRRVEHLVEEDSNSEVALTPSPGIS